jgi:hypothetical protein
VFLLAMFACANKRMVLYQPGGIIEIRSKVPLWRCQDVVDPFIFHKSKKLSCPHHTQAACALQHKSHFQLYFFVMLHCPAFGHVFSGLAAAFGLVWVDLAFLGEFDPAEFNGEDEVG